MEGTRRMSQETQTNYKFIDLFAGTGGLRLAFEANGCSCVYSSEWDKFAQKTYETNFHEVPDGDIRELDASTLPDFDILVGGFPCQPFSIAGIPIKHMLGKSIGFEDETQGTMFFEICRILKERRPRAFFLENVKNLKSHDHGHTYEVICKSLDDLGYAHFDRIVDAQRYTPQHRERIVIMGFDKQRYGEDIDFAIDDRLDAPERKPLLRDVLIPNDEVDEKYTLSDKTWGYLQEHAKRHKSKGHGFGYSIGNPDGYSRTISARYGKDGSECLIAQNGKNPRKLTPREAARLQGFPDSFVFPVSDTQAYKQVGNAVCIPLMTALAKQLVSKLDEMES